MTDTTNIDAKYTEGDLLCLSKPSIVGYDMSFCRVGFDIEDEDNFAVVKDDNTLRVVVIEYNQEEETYILLLSPTGDVVSESRYWVDKNFEPAI